MASLNYLKTVTWDPNLLNAGTNADSLVIDGQYNVSGTPANIAGKYIAGAMILNISDGKWYRNSGTTASPNFVNASTGGSFSLPITTNFGAGKFSQYDQNANILGVGITGTADIYTNDNLGSFTGNVFGDFTAVGGSTNSYLAGYQSLSGPVNASFNAEYDIGTDVANAGLSARSGLGQVNLQLDSNGGYIRFNFGGGNTYTFPNATPNLGDVLTAGVGGSTSWAAPTGGTLTIGNPISGGTANHILFEDSSNTLNESSDFTFVKATGEFTVALSGNKHLYINPAGTQYYIGDGTGAGNTTLIEILDGIPLIRNWVLGQFLVQRPNAGPSLIDGNTSTFNLYLGDVGNVANKTNIEIIDQNSLIYLNVHASGGGLGLIRLGDGNNDGNSTMFQLNDFARQTIVQTDGDFGVQTIIGQRALNIDFAGGTAFTVEAGDVNNGANGTKLQVLDAVSTVQAVVGDLFKVYDTSNNEWLRVDIGNQAVELGDISSAGNGTLLEVNDLTQRVTITNVPAYADDTAATGAGLTTGMLYKTTTGGSTFLKIVP